MQPYIVTYKVGRHKTETVFPATSARSARVTFKQAHPGAVVLTVYPWRKDPALARANHGGQAVG